MSQYQRIAYFNNLYLLVYKPINHEHLSTDQFLWARSQWNINCVSIFIYFVSKLQFYGFNNNLFFSVVVFLAVCLVGLATSSAVPEEEKPSCFCPRNYVPVCGSDDVTYDNMCIFECNRDFYQKTRSIELRIAQRGRCPEVYEWS